MALSPADFAAYSRATGTPYPEDPEERAALAPVVRDFRQSQLRQQESGPNLGALAGLAAVGLGALGLGLAARRGFGAKAAGGGRKGGVTLADLSDPRNVAVSQVAETAVKPSIPTQRSVMPTEAEAKEQYSRQLTEMFPEPTASEMEALSSPSRMGKILARLGTSPQYRPDPKDINYARFGPPSPEVAAARREQATQDLLRFAQQRQEDAAIVANQTIGALESGEDQMTGRAMLGAQRNEDLDLAQINSVARQTGDADVALSMTSDGVPVDQVERQLLPGDQDYYYRLDKIIHQQNIEANPRPLTLEDMTRNLQSMRAEKQLVPGDKGYYSRLDDIIHQQNIEANSRPLKAEDLARNLQSLSKQTSEPNIAAPVDQVELTQPISAQDLANQAKEEMIARRQSLEAAGLRPGTVRFERALAQPFRTSSSQQVTGTQPIEFALPAGPVRRTVESVGAQDPLIERSVLNIGPQAVVTSTAAGTAIRGASPSYHEAMPKEPLRQLYGTADVLVPGAPNEVGPDLPGSLRVRGGIAPDVEPQLLSKQEIVYSVLDRPETLGPAGGSAGIGVYGLEPGFVPGAVSKATGEYSEAASRKPSYVPGWLQKRQSKTGFESLTTPQLAAGAEAAKAPGIKASFESELAKRETTKQSLEASEIARRAIIEGRDPQTILRQRGFNV